MGARSVERAIGGRAQERDLGGRADEDDCGGVNQLAGTGRDYRGARSAVADERDGGRQALAVGGEGRAHQHTGGAGVGAERAQIGGHGDGGLFVACGGGELDSDSGAAAVGHDSVVVNGNGELLALRGGGEAGGEQSDKERQQKGGTLKHNAGRHFALRLRAQCTRGRAISRASGRHAFTRSSRFCVVVARGSHLERAAGGLGAP